tara:strand:+ start:620 stop:1003 length:384 start_codon:yes stop_codon:yes gene_type:complete
MRLGVQYPIHAGGFAAAYDASSVNDTDWHNLTSDDFYDTRTGDQLPSGLQFAFVEVVSGSTDTKSFLKLRAASSGSDGVANSDGVIPVFATYSVDIQALISGSGVTTVAYKKAAGGDNFVLYAGFNK